MNKKYKLKELCEITSSKRIFAHEYVEKGISFFRSKEIIELANEQKIDEPLFISEERYNEIKKKFNIPKNGDILLSAIGANLGIPYWVNLDFEFYFKDGNVIWFRNFSSKLDSEYLFWWMNTNYFFKQFTDKAIGAAQKALTIDSLNEYLVEVPSLKEQRDAIKIFRAISKKIIVNNKINAELEVMAKTLYDYWFIQFDFPNKNNKPYKNSGGKMIYSNELKKEIPEGWEVDRINKKIKIESGFPFNSDDYCENGKYQIITIKNVQDGYLDTSTVDKIDLIPDNISDFCVLEIGDVLMSLTGNVGRMCFVDKENLLLNQRVGKLLGEKEFIIYTYLFFKRPENQKRLEKIAGGSSQSNLSPINAVKDFFIIPSQNILNDFSKIIIPIFEQIIRNKKENRELSEQRDWLLPMLMNGQVTVK
ncbi:MAG: restriction endonuclease subunit S [Candidatus Paceibacterota bacterium]